MKYLSVSRAGCSSLPIALAALMLWGCAGFLGEESLIENPDLPGTRALVLSASFTNADTLLTMHIDRAAGVFSDQVGWDTLWGPFFLLDNRNEADSRGFRAELSEEGTPIASFSYTDEEIVPDFSTDVDVSELRRNYVAAAGGSVFREGRRYTLELEHPELGTYSMSQVMPQAVTSAQLVMGPLTPYGNWEHYPCRLSFQPPHNGGYYAVSLYYGRPSAGGEVTWLGFPASSLFSTDPRVLQGAYGKSVFFSGADFGAGPITVDFTVGKHSTGLQVAGYSVMAITKEAYLTLRSFHQFLDAEGGNMLGNFTDPFEMYSNVPGGHGFFLLGNIRFFDY